MSSALLRRRKDSGSVKSNSGRNVGDVKKASVKGRNKSEGHDGKKKIQGLDSSEDNASDASEFVGSEQEEEEEESVASEDIDNEAPVARKNKRKRPSDGVSDGDGGRNKKVRGAKEKDAAKSKKGEAKRAISGKVISSVKEVEAPKHQAPPGEIASTTLEFLTQLSQPANNDRDWFAIHTPLFKHANANWLEFINAIQPLLIEADDTLPQLPAKDLVHRIYRDIRFTNDKTPYKPYFSAALSRTGRKGPYAMYWLQIQPGNKSVLACGCWSPSASDLVTLRNQFLKPKKARQFRKIMEEDNFVRLFGPPRVGGRGEGKKSGVFGHEDALKKAPKINGMGGPEVLAHPEIELLKLRSIVVSITFKDEEVLSKDFKLILFEVVKVMAPFVQFLNELLLPSSPDSDGEESDDEDLEAEGDQGHDESEQEQNEEDDPDIL